MKYQGKITDPKDLVTKEYVDTGLSGKLGTSGDGSNVTAAFTAASSRTNISTGEKLNVIFGKIAKWFADLGAAAFRNVDSVPTANSTNLAESGGVKSAINFVPDTGNAGWHNSIYRGKNLGSSVTAAQWAAISAGTFDDLYIGDYWTINGVNWRIAAFDYYIGIGDPAPRLSTHHVVIVPDTCLLSDVIMSDRSVGVTGAYLGSDFFTGNNNNVARATVETMVKSAFGSSHILSYRAQLTNAVTSNKASGNVWTDISSVSLMSETMVYGVHSSDFNAAYYEVGVEKSQLPLFALDHSRIIASESWWLRGIATINDQPRFCVVANNGNSSNRVAYSSGQGARPHFLIKA